MASNEWSGGAKLSDVFDKIWSVYEDLENSKEPSNSEIYQAAVSCGISEAERAVLMVNELSLFSKNEHIDEVASRDIRYMLLPAFLGYFTDKNQKLDRFDAVCKSQVYFVDFIRLCKMYELTDCELPELYVKSSDSDEPPQIAPRSRSGQLSLEEQNKKREKKIEQLRRRRNAEQALRDLSHYAKQDHADDEQIRRYYLALVDKWLTDAFDNIDSFEAELPILEHMAKMKSKGQPQPETQEKRCTGKAAALRPFIITKNELQKKVFGLGYPGIPTVTVDEFYDQRVREGLFPSAEQVQSHQHAAATTTQPTDAEQEDKKAEQDEQLSENDNVESLRRQREWDDWRDDHRRGWGNTHNKG